MAEAVLVSTIRNDVKERELWRRKMKENKEEDENQHYPN